MSNTETEVAQPTNDEIRTALRVLQWFENKDGTMHSAETELAQVRAFLAWWVSHDE